MFRFLRWAPLIALLTCTGMHIDSAAWAQGITEIVAISGDPAPDGNGTFSSFIVPALNDTGQVAFVSGLSDTSAGPTGPRGVFRGTTAPGSLVQIARELEAVPDGNGTFSNFVAPSINEAGEASFAAILAHTAGTTTDDSGIYRGAATSGSLVQVAREGQQAPDGNGDLADLSFVGPELNDAGQVAFRTELTGTTGGADDDTAIFRGDGGALSTIVRKGQLAPDGIANFASLAPSPALNSAGQVAFQATLTSVGGEGVFLAAGGPITTIVRNGQPAPDGNGTIFSAGIPALNDAGQVAFVGDLTGGTADNEGLFRGEGAALTTIARKGQPAPDGNGVLDTVNDFTINNTGHVIFTTRLTGTAGGTSDNSVVLFGDGGLLTVVAHEGQTVPGGNGNFRTFNPASINDSFQAVFRALIRDTTGVDTDDSGLYFSDPVLGLREIAREGSPFLGSAFTTISFNSSFSGRSDERNGLNELGQVTFAFTLADGRNGVALWSVPEPSSLGLGVLLALCFVGRPRPKWCLEA